MLNTLFQLPDYSFGAYLLHSCCHYAGPFAPTADHPGPETSLEKAMQLIKGRSSHRIH